MQNGKKFPKGFLWGASSASFQVEGGIENNDWAEASRKERVPPAGKSTDHYNLFEQDFDIAKSLGMNAQRVSIEWARIEPEEGKFDKKEIEHYRKVIQALRNRGLEPFVTLWHFTLPEWFAKKGGFENKKSAEIFARYCLYVVNHLGNLARFWMTLNEPMIYDRNAYIKGKWPPFKKSHFRLIRVSHHLVRAHRFAYEAIKKHHPQLLVGIATNNISFGVQSSTFYLPLVIFLRWFWSQRFLNAISDCQDFIGLNYYFHKRFGNPKTVEEKTDMGWEIYPKGIYNVLLDLKKYKKPIYITENGLADESDTRRAKFIREHLEWVLKAIGEGMPVKGYFYWALTDNYEWIFGFGPRFGLVQINYDTMERKIRASAYHYKRICESNSLPE